MKRKYGSMAAGYQSTYDIVLGEHQESFTSTASSFAPSAGPTRQGLAYQESVKASHSKSLSIEETKD